MHAVGSVYAPHGSAGATPASGVLQLQGGQLPPPSSVLGHAGQTQVLVPPGEPGEVPPPPLTTPPDPQSHAQGAQLAPAGHAGQAQAQVPPVTQPLPPPPPPPLQSQVAGGHVCPAAHGAALQVQLPPPEPPPEQSHSVGGQVELAGQYSGLAQAHPPPLGVVSWQKPPAPQSAPRGHSRPIADQAQPDWAVQLAEVECCEQVLVLTHAPVGQAVPAGHAIPRVRKRQPEIALQLAVSFPAAQLALER